MIISRIIYFAIFGGLFGHSSIAMTEEPQYEICFNFTIITKQNADVSEDAQFKQQKSLLHEEVLRTQSVFDKNNTQNCPKIKFAQEKIKHVTWEQALQLSKPLEQGLNEKTSDYQKTKIKEHLSKIESIASKIKQTPDIKYYDLLDLSPGFAIVNAKNALVAMDNEQRHEDYIKSYELEKLRTESQASITVVVEKLNDYGVEKKNELVNRAELILKKYNEIDQASSNSWKEGILTLWNDDAAQDTSIELKNLIQHYHSQGNNCIDVYVVPKANSPSRNPTEIEKNNDWTIRGGAALSEKLFPRTTAGRGHAIILTQDGGKTESRLAHELGHLLIAKRDAHFGKVAKDLMHEKSLGGSYLDEEECKRIKENIIEF
tara:strand:- start:2767 stop:3888 length:1122 start_codon:yes stop_codon:yes gene_type:complete